MHGTFPFPRSEGRSSSRSEVASFLVCLAFAAAPLIAATLVAVLRFGIAVRASDIIDVLVAATLAAPL
jgi:hypothetical protein